MSPGEGAQPNTERCFPRVSGDEPALREAVKRLGVFSPRERG